MCYKCPTVRTMSLLEAHFTEKLILELHEVRIVDFGKFKLKSGLISPYYLDLRLLVTFPSLLELVSDLIWDRVRLIPFDLIVGVPYAALPIATALSIKRNKPLLLVRKERKEHGKGKLIEGIYHKAQHVLIIDDVISDGASKLETISPLEDEGLVIKDIIVIVDRGQGGVSTLAAHGYRCHSITTTNEILEVLHRHGRINWDQYTECLEFTQQARNQKAQKPIKLPKGKST